ncbi:MAG: hypothetical protein U1F43_24015 [Myxococcota bacterium]
MFRRALSETGAFELTWPAVPAASLHAWLLLVDPERLDPSQLRPEVLLRELIRTPLVPGARRARLYVPAGRVVGLALVARDAADEPLASPPFELVDAPVDAPVDVAPAPVAAAVAPVPARAAPVAMPGARVERAPFVFAASARPRGAGPGVSFEALADRVAASASVPAARTPGPTGFGTRQRFI